MKKSYEEVTSIWPVPYDLIDTWFLNHQYINIINVVKECKRKSDYDLLQYILHKAQYYYEYPNASNFSREELIKKGKELCFGTPTFINYTDEEVINFINYFIKLHCSAVLRFVAVACKRKYSYYQPIAEELIALEDENIRCYCAAIFDYHRFLKDKYPRAAKIARIRQRFENYWNRLSDDDIEKKRILFIYKALKQKEIMCWNLSDAGEDKANTYLTSTYFKPERRYYWKACDVDIRDRLDKIILANLISIKFKRWDVKLIGKNIPDYMNDNKGRQLTLNRKND